MGKLTTILILVLLAIEGICQHTIYSNSHIPMPSSGKSYYYLKNHNSIADKVSFGRVVSYFKVNLENQIQEEYFRANDSIYQYRKHEKGEICEKGFFKIDLSKPVKIDTVWIVCSYGQYEDEYIYYHSYEPIKFGYWKIKENGQWTSGSFSNNKKKGTWRRNIGPADNKLIAYSQGDTLGVSEPIRTDIERHKDFLLENRFRKCLYLDKNNKPQKTYSWKLPNASDCNCKNFIELDFKSDMSVEIEQFGALPSHHTGLGSYYFEENRLNITFQNGETTCIELTYYGKDKIEGRSCK